MLNSGSLGGLFAFNSMSRPYASLSLAKFLFPAIVVLKAYLSPIFL
jgi:hypothetical protein